jgi:hypothetical protein
MTFSTVLIFEQWLMSIRRKRIIDAKKHLRNNQVSTNGEVPISVNICSFMQFRIIYDWSELQNLGTPANGYTDRSDDIGYATSLRPIYLVM